MVVVVVVIVVAVSLELCVCSLIEGFVEHVQCSIVVSSSGN